MSKVIIEAMYMDGDILHCMPYTDDQRAKAKADWQIICDKKPSCKKIVRGLKPDGRYVESGDTDYPWDEETAITVDVDYGFGGVRTFLSHKYREGMIAVTTRKGKKVDVVIRRCIRRSMADIMDEMLAKPDFDRLWFIEEIMA